MYGRCDGQARIAETASRIRRGGLSAVEVAEQALSSIETREQGLNSYASIGRIRHFARRRR